MSRRQRGIRETLQSIVLVLEAIVVFFATMVAYGLSGLEPWVVFTGGGALIVLLVVVAWLQRHAWAVWPGWALQAAIMATGVLVPLMFVIGAGFAAMWVWAVVRARQIEAQQAAAGGGSS